MSVSASGGTGRVATNVSCFGGLGQLHRVKAWAVNGPNISRALVCILDGQCIEEGMCVSGVYILSYNYLNETQLYCILTHTIILITALRL